ncbi:hypothetical protein CAEBREN_08742 [Caenorhabditis brenneri]|uniref:BTB domain-containing protein n=1 Tax=Caenorhabditis brenneri TaxID=135651 RepID=G0MDB7_CAEBE|nr:hypothetical protein CAEBREN_08742 [Caenorhabditis brenneri]
METPKKEMLLTHVAKDFSSLASGYRFGPEMLFANIPWQLAYRKTENQAVGVYLFCRRPKTDENWSVATNVTIRFLSVNGKEWSIDFHYVFANDSEFLSYGCTFNSWDILLKDYVVDDSLVFEIKATIGSITGIEKPDVLRDFNASSAFTDVALKVGEKKFFVSKVYLATQSENFKTLLFGGFKEANQAEVELKEVDPEAFQIFLELIYMENTLTDSNIEDVLVLVDKYHAKNPARVCEEFLINNSNHCIRTKLRIAAQYNFKALKDHCLNKLTCRAEIRAVLGVSATGLDPSICAALLEKSLSLK